MAPVGKINVLTLSTDEGQDDTSPAILKRRRLRWHRSCNSEKVGRLSCSAKITRHSSILEVGKINVLTLSTDEGQDDTSPAILKRWGDYPAFAKIIRHPSILEVGRIDVLTLSTDEGQEDTGPAILKNKFLIQTFTAFKLWNPKLDRFEKTGTVP
ncbi:hypothetical protein GQ457_08G019950 [Hibiscus cannabinus]